MLWLYKHGYDIEEQLEVNQDLSQIETDLDNLAFEVAFLAKHLADEKTKERLTDLLQNNYYKEGLPPPFLT